MTLFDVCNESDLLKKAVSELVGVSLLLEQMLAWNVSTDVQKIFQRLFFIRSSYWDWEELGFLMYCQLNQTQTGLNTNNREVLCNY